MAKLEEFKQRLLGKWTPLVALVATPEADSFCLNHFGENVNDVFLSNRRIKGLNKGIGGTR